MRHAKLVLLAVPILAVLTACGGGGTTTGTDTASPTTAATTTATSTDTSSTGPSGTSSNGSPGTSTSGSPGTSASAGAGALGDNFQALGTEPFWSVAVTDTTLKYTQPDQPDRTLYATKGGDVDEPTFTGSNEGVDFRLEIKREACSDGMSDTQYDYSAEFHYGEVELKGCARTA